MKIMSDATARAEMPKGSQSVLDRRTVVTANANLLQLVKRGDRVLDVGCGSGAITKDIAGLVGAEGFVMGIDTSEHLIAQAQKTYAHIPNLAFAVADVNKFKPAELFDLVTSARVLQWLAHPAQVVRNVVPFLKQGGCLTVLDYNHTKVEFSPDIPNSMRKLYDAFLQWRADAGMVNAIADHLEAMFSDAGLAQVSSEDYSETSIRGQSNFQASVIYWVIVAEVRGPQLVTDQYITEADRQQAIRDYRSWMNTDAQYMKLYLRAISGYRP